MWLALGRLQQAHLLERFGQLLQHIRLQHAVVESRVNEFFSIVCEVPRDRCPFASRIMSIFWS
jgi:hypothetical protein